MYVLYIDYPNMIILSSNKIINDAVKKVVYATNI